MRRFSTRLILAAAAIGGGYAAARMLAPQLQRASLLPATPANRQLVSQPPAPNLTAGQGGAAAEGEAILETVVAALEQRPIITAKVRQELRLDNQLLSGEGRYWQQGVGNQRRSRWEIKTLVGDEQAFFTQVYAHFPDGEFVWTDRRLPYSRVVSRIDVASVRREIGASYDLPDRQAPTAAAIQAELLARGGLTQLFAELDRSFTFSSPVVTRRGNAELLSLIGQWRPAELARQWPTAATGGEWPPHLPHHVLLELGAKDRFPYYLEYRTGQHSSLAAAPEGLAPAPGALARYEFFEVSFSASIPPQTFEYSPADFDWRDVTTKVIDRLRPLIAPTPAGAPQPTPNLATLPLQRN